MNKEQKITNWIKSKQDDLDKIIYEAGKEYYEKNIKGDTQLHYDLQVNKEESFNLTNGKDLCYDRPTIGFTYSLYYHPRRINTFLNYFLKILTETGDSEIQIFDLGAGTGAVQYAIGLIYCAIKENGYEAPSLKIINIDTSPFMLYYNRDFLWKHFLSHKDLKFSAEIETDHEINSWNNTKNINSNNPWIVASYLFDQSENKDELANDFKGIIEKFKPSTVALLTSFQKNKIDFIENVTNSIKKLQFNEVKSASNSKNDQIFSGELVKTTSLRKDLKICINPTKWDIDSLYGKLLLTNNPTLNLNSKTNFKRKIFLFNPPIVVRRNIELNEDQQKAAEINDRPTCITGPAGCGKSVVITEKIKNLVIQKNYNPKLRILFTTFNKELVKELVKWLKQLLDPKKCKFYPNRKEFYVKFTNSNIKNIRILHFDILATYLGDLKIGNLNIVNDKTHRVKLKEIIEKYKSDNSINDNIHDNILNSDFIFEEFQRVVYGLQYFTELDYMNKRREGRGHNPRLDPNSERRKIVWKIIFLYLESMKIENYYSFTSIRYMFLKKLKENKSVEKYDYIFVDEFQDCSKAEFEIFYQLINDPNNITISGDLAQALQLGSSAHVPRKNGDVRMRNYDYKRLNGSYRLPLRICECIGEISSNIFIKQGGKRADDDEDLGSKLLPYKGAPPGARPIIVYGKTLDNICNKINDAFKKYKVYSIDKISILEKDDELRKKLSSNGIVCESNSILRIKGLEKTCVLWSTRIGIDFVNEVEEFIYTILTRTSSILIIALSDNIMSYYKEILKIFNKDRIICWDEESKKKFDELTK